MQYETVIGLEVHVHLKTKTKAFCGCSTEYGKEPNSQTCPVCLGLPGSLPVLNKMALELTIKTALALNCTVNNYLKFDRKNYYYPDLPKNYQISQYDMPISSNGFIILTSGKKIRIKRAHLEEDAGKLIHEKDSSLVDYNRSGMPLLEIVSEPDINSPDEAYEYLSKLKLVLQYIGISDCDMEKGSLRCDANISLRKMGAKELGVKTELKNMNSFKAVREALGFEIKRQTEALNNGERIIQDTRLWDDQKEITTSMRSKEEAHDYRYFPEPDLVPFSIENKFIEEIKKEIPELPQMRFERFVKDLQLSEYDANVIIQDKNFADYFEECTRLYKNAKKISNWLCGAVLSELNSRKVDIQELKLQPKDLIGLIEETEKGTVSNLVAKEVLTQIIDTGKSAHAIISEKGMAQVSDEGALEKLADEAIKENPKSVESYKSGKENAIMFLVGQVMKKSGGKANPKVVGEILKRRLI
ncbi:MAG: Asp-tRNA(Asn)/Glu-tRNA(Gln) amidotransferase subunit GatB [Candidatus Omnitrophica bacterium]|nr:Asp-tRNA(Asn)/Glu-tRNA(Gln) amidotransferase subunit GatB [Candidatus Omnitrophota bacterium]